jgi:addiction module HigA family antidote
MIKDKLNPIHPGEVLLEEFLKPMNISTSQIAQDLKISQDIIEQIIEGKKPISADIALRLARYFNVSPQFWLGLQMDYDLDIAEDQIGEKINKEVLCCIA